MKNISEYLKETVKNIAQDSETKIKKAYQRIKEDYHDFIIVIDKKIKVLDYEVPADECPEGVFTEGGKTYAHAKEPYVKVDGRIAMFVDEHIKSNCKFNVTSNIDDICRILETKGKICPYYPLVVRVDSEKYGRLEGVSRINWGGENVDKTNPIENAYTSALGRALGEAGFGLVGTGVASADEVLMAKQIAANKQNTKQAKTGSQNTNNSTKKNNDTNNKKTNNISATMRITENPSTDTTKVEGVNNPVWTVQVEAQIQGKIWPGKIYIPTNAIEEKQLTSLQKGDLIKITGKMKLTENEFVILAKEIKNCENAA